MHWSNGRFHKDITVGEKIYITDHKHIAISGGIDYTQYGESSINSYVHGKEVGITANDNFYADSTTGSDIWSKQYIHIEAGSSSVNHGNHDGNGIEIISANGVALFSSEQHEAAIQSINNRVFIKAGSYVALDADIGITINNTNYGAVLPTSDNVEGRIFFKLIS